MYRIGDEVAILVTPSELRQFASIVDVGPAVVELDNGGLYFLDDGKAMHDSTYLKLATVEHRAGPLCCDLELAPICGGIRRLMVRA